MSKIIVCFSLCTEKQLCGNLYYANLNGVVLANSLWEASKVYSIICSYYSIAGNFQGRKRLQILAIHASFLCEIGGVVSFGGNTSDTIHEHFLKSANL